MKAGPNKKYGIKKTLGLVSCEIEVNVNATSERLSPYSELLNKFSQLIWKKVDHVNGKEKMRPLPTINTLA
jgi:hypothetical protein